MATILAKAGESVRTESATLKSTISDGKNCCDHKPKELEEDRILGQSCLPEDYETFRICESLCGRWSACLWPDQISSCFGRRSKLFHNPLMFVLLSTWNVVTLRKLGKAVNLVFIYRFRIQASTQWCSNYCLWLRDSWGPATGTNLRNTGCSPPPPSCSCRRRCRRTAPSIKESPSNQLSRLLKEKKTLRFLSGRLSAGRRIDKSMKIEADHVTLSSDLNDNL